MAALSRKLAPLWLRDKATELRGAAARADRAYTTGGGYEAARYVAAQYYKAAALLDDAADRFESATDAEVSQ
jgi:hypothetical protein